MEPTSIIAGVVAGDIAHKVAQEINNTDDEVEKYIQEGNIEAAIQESNKSMMGNIYVAIKDVIEREDDVNVTNEEMNQFKDYIERESGKSIEHMVEE